MLDDEFRIQTRDRTRTKERHHEPWNTKACSDASPALELTDWQNLEASSSRDYVLATITDISESHAPFIFVERHDVPMEMKDN